MEIFIGLVLSVGLNIILMAKVGSRMVQGKENTITEEEIRQMVDAGGDNGSIDENEKEMINNIFELGNLSAGSIATHRTDIVAVPLDATLEDIKSVTEEEKYSRIVVYDDNIDNIVGVYHVKDMVKYILADVNRVEEGNFHLEDLLMEPYFVPFSKKVDELLEEMQLEKVHMAIVIDEYGGTAGIVTMEDIMEEIFGNIFDEYDEEEEEDITQMEENVYRINGSTDLQDVEEQLEVEFEEHEDYDTLGGYLIGRLGRIPEDDEMIEMELHGWLFRVEIFEEKRILKVLASKLPDVTEIAAEDAEDDKNED
ncbi:MAG: HlyC/CorC family transporter [Anaerotignum sp.]|nr:HlyC/CorC family transporter [Anaerotignum sp.]MBQ3567747.1 HlyC/CorC family transporter [Anaerotignum sp.]